jgi:MYXO-CTERM domain-containing protein
VGSYRIEWYASDAYGESAPAGLTVTVSDAIGTVGNINAPIVSSSSAGGGGGSLEGDLMLWSLALLALGRRIRRC